jgi:hypothetical protein
MNGSEKAVKRPAETNLAINDRPVKKMKTDSFSSRNPTDGPEDRQNNSLRHLLQWKDEMELPVSPQQPNSFKLTIGPI